MKVEMSNIEKLVILDLKNIDNITVFLEDLAPRQGRITISCYNESWTAYWGGIGERTIAEFFLMCDEGYLAKNLAQNLYATVIDVENMAEHARRQIIWERRHGGMDTREARNLFSQTDDLENAENETTLYDVHSDLLSDVFGDEWYRNLPTVPNGKYTYLCRIINSVKEAIRLAKSL